MTDNNRILITGATGNVGRELVKILHGQGQPVRAALYAESEKAKLPVPDVETRLFDFDDSGTYGAAFAGVDRLFLMRPPAITDIERTIKPVIAYAAAHGVRHITFLSLLGAEKNRIVPHAKVEKLLLGGTVPYTLLRCGFFMQNLSTTHLKDIRRHDDLFIPAGSGKTAFIDVRDITAVAAKTLTEPGHENQAYPLTGSEALDYDQVAQILTEAAGRPIGYSRPSLPRFIWRLWRRGQPLGYVAVVAGIYLTTRLGLAKAVTPHTARLLGRPPISFRQFALDHAEVW